MFFSYLNHQIKTMYIDNQLYGGLNYIIPYYDISRDISVSIPQINNIIELANGLFIGLYKATLGNFNLFSLNIFHIIQSIENLLILIVVSIITYFNFSKDKKNFIFWLLFLLIILGTLGLIIQNFGTLSRFKYSFIVLFIIAVSSINFKNRTIQK